jgi:hypothetical protein
MRESPLLDYAALQQAPVTDDPFPHIVVRHFLPERALARVQDGLPKIARGGSFPPEALRLGPAARSLVAEMQARPLRAAIAEKFGLDLDDAPSMLTVRLHCREKDGEIHTDSASKRVTILLYLNSAQTAFNRQEGCLRLLRAPDDLENYAVEVPPVDGTLLVFPNGPNTWHGHRTFVGQRFSMQLNYMANDSAARGELRRHKVSAWVKRLLPAA